MNDKEKQPVLEINDLSISFSMYDKGLRKKDLEVIHSISLNLRQGEILVVVGSSGSGKSLLAHSIMGILPNNAKATGTIKYYGKELKVEEIRGKEIAFIPQSVDFLDPLMRIDKQVIGVRGSKKRQEEVFKRYNLDKNVGKMYPFQLSGGMARRVLIATAIMENSKIIVADEPTPGLSKDMALDTLKHFRELADEGCSVLMITHDVDLALTVADRIGVFYAGTIVEIAPVGDFIKGKEYLRHPYSKAFIDALPQNSFVAIKGFQPSSDKLPKGCLFFDRCTMKTEECSKKIEMRSLRGGEVRCIHAT